MIIEPEPKTTTETRRAELSDCEDDCPICQQMRERILAGNAPMVTVISYENGATGVFELPENA